MYISSGGTAVSTIISSGGYQYVWSSATAIRTTISAYGIQDIYAGATAISTTISSGGSQYISKGGTAINTIIYDYGFQSVADGAVNDGLVRIGSLYVGSGGTGNGIMVSSGGQYIIGSGGTAISTTILEGGNQYISKGGTASGASILSGGTMYVSSGAVLAGNISAAGTLNVYYGADVSSAGIIFDITGRSETDTSIITNYAAVSTAKTFSFNADSSKAGRYSLADYAAAFNRSITLINSRGDALGSLDRTNGMIHSGFAYELAVDSSTLTIGIFDVSSMTVRLSASKSAVEGGKITYTASVGQAAERDLHVTLESGLSITILAGTTTGSAYATAPNDPYAGTPKSVTDHIVSASGGGFRYEGLFDGGAVSTTVTDTVDTTTVTLSGPASVQEGEDITYTVKTSNPTKTAATATVNVGGTTYTVTIAAGASSGTLVIANPNPADAYKVTVPSLTAKVTGFSGGSFEKTDFSNASATVRITDVISDADITKVTLSATASVTEGSTINYTARMERTSAQDVTVKLRNGQTITI
ncbi:MAG: hypothetical protein MJ061_04250, partial [Mailhella sp.]|nr:hypothetical protein [Mailhella sp.]